MTFIIVKIILSYNLFYGIVYFTILMTYLINMNTIKFDPLRVKQLELLLRWEGQISNARLREIYGFTSVRASQWIKEFRDYQPSWTSWNSFNKNFVATFKFYQYKGDDDSTSLTKYLSLVGMSASSDNSDQQIVSAFSDITTPNPIFFSTLSNAARLGRDVEILYSSLKEPEPHIRIISPHSIVKAGPRWHVRAYSQQHQQFRDYTFGRISNVKILDENAKFGMKDDEDWMTEVKVRLIAHPDLSWEKQSVIRLEYFAKTAARVTICRGPLVNYFVKEVNAAVDVKKQVPPEYLLAVENIEELSKWLYSK